MSAATYFVINDMKEAETEAKAHQSHVLFNSCIHEKKSMHSHDEYDTISQTTETWDKPEENNPATQDCDSNHLYVKEELYS